MGWIVGARVSEAGRLWLNGEAALRLLDEAGGKRPRSLGADARQYQERESQRPHCDNVGLRRTWLSTKKGQLRVRNSLREEGARQCGICAQPAETEN